MSEEEEEYSKRFFEIERKVNNLLYRSDTADEIKKQMAFLTPVVRSMNETISELRGKIDRNEKLLKSVVAGEKQRWFACFFAIALIVVVRFL
jgi:truncated hemoglobin YjbI